MVFVGTRLPGRRVAQKKSRAFPESNFAKVARFLDRYIPIHFAYKKGRVESRVEDLAGSISYVWKSRRIAQIVKKENSCKLTRSYAYEIFKLESPNVSFQSNGQERSLP